MSTADDYDSQRCDPVLDAYLAFLAEDMAANQDIQPLSAESLARARALVGRITADPNQDLGDDIELE